MIKDLHKITQPLLYDYFYPGDTGIKPETEDVAELISKLVYNHALSKGIEEDDICQMCKGEIDYVASMNDFIVLELNEEDVKLYYDEILKILNKNE